MIRTLLALTLTLATACWGLADEEISINADAQPVVYWSASNGQYFIDGSGTYSCPPNSEVRVGAIYERVTYFVDSVKVRCLKNGVVFAEFDWSVSGNSHGTWSTVLDTVAGPATRNDVFLVKVVAEGRKITTTANRNTGQFQDVVARTTGTAQYRADTSRVDGQ